MKTELYIKFFLVLLFSSLVFNPGCDTVEEEMDYTYSIEKVWWSDSIDTNQDGYIQAKRINFNVRLAENVSRNVTARLYYKPHDASSYSFYAYSEQQTVQGNGVDNSIFVAVGSPNKELPRGTYDFKVSVYESGKDDLKTETGSRDSLLLTNQKFEESAADKNYSISCWWRDSYDRNQNGYFQYSSLVINVDIDADVKKNVYLKMYYKAAMDETYKLYSTTNTFEITAQDTADTISCNVGSIAEELNYGEYDFRLELYEASSNILVAFTDELSTSTLDNVKFEEEDKDVYYYSVTNISWSDSIDIDGDGFTQFRKLNFNVDVDKEEQRTIFARVYYLHPDSTESTFYSETANFNITGTASGDNQFFNIGTTVLELDSTAYDFMISIFEPIDTVAQYSVGVSYDSKLSQQKFEPAIKDVNQK